MHQASKDTSRRVTAATEATERIVTTVQAIINGSRTLTSGTPPKPAAPKGLHNPSTQPIGGVPGVSGNRTVLPTDYGPVSKQPGRPPNARHNLSRIGKGAPSKANNTVAIPPTSMDDDIADINAGKARYDPETQSYITSGRRYKIKDNGTMYPLDGPGLVNLSREEFNALKTMVKHRGDLEQAWDAIRRDPRMSRGTFDSVRDRVFRHHKDFKDQ